MLIEVDGSHHLRATARYKLFQPTEVVLAGRAVRAHLLNLSAGGALVSATSSPSPGVELVVRCGNRALGARVAWRKEHLFGVAFVSPPTDAYVREFIAAHDTAAAARIR